MTGSVRLYSIQAEPVEILHRDGVDKDPIGLDVEAEPARYDRARSIRPDSVVIGSEQHPSRLEFEHVLLGAETCAVCFLCSGWCPLL